MLAHAVAEEAEQMGFECVHETAPHPDADVVCALREPVSTSPTSSVTTLELGVVVRGARRGRNVVCRRVFCPSLVASYYSFGIAQLA